MIIDQQSLSGEGDGRGSKLYVLYFPGRVAGMDECRKREEGGRERREEKERCSISSQVVSVLCAREVGEGPGT